MSQARLIFWGIIILGIAGAGGWFTYRWVEAELVKARAAETQAKRSATQAALRAKVLSEALSASETISRKRNQAKLSAEKDAKLFQSAFEALYAQSKVAKNWGDSPIPLDIRCLRRKLNPTESDNLLCPNGPIKPDGDTEPSGSDEYRPFERKSNRAERFTKLQP